MKVVSCTMEHECFFYQVEPGEPFEYEGNCYMRLGAEYGNFNAIDFKTGMLECFDNCTTVRLPHKIVPMELHF